MHTRLFILLLSLPLLQTCNDSNTQVDAIFGLTGAFLGQVELDLSGSNEDLPLDQFISLKFSAPVDESTIDASISLSSASGEKTVSRQLSTERDVLIRPVGILESNTEYTIQIRNTLRNKAGDSVTETTIVFKTQQVPLSLNTVLVDGNIITAPDRVQNIDPNLSIRFDFSAAVQASALESALILSQNPGLQVTNLNDSSLEVRATQPLEYLSLYNLSISSALEGKNGEPFSGYAMTFYTQLDSSFKFPELTDEELLTKVQEQTFQYFWSFGHPGSGLARERNTSGDLVTIGGSGFGLMAILVGIERGFITRQEGLDRLEKIITFLDEKAERFHGVWSHWLHGSTGEVIPFSPDDDGADLVESAFMVQGLLTVRQYLDDSEQREAEMISRINSLWQEVEWDWHTRGGQNVLYWHWSPNFGWQKNLRISGWNESLIVYILAASSPTHAITAEVYESGWARSGNMQNGGSFYGIPLPLGQNRGGPLFFSHYSFLGLDPRNLEDQYANYWDQNVAHSQINFAYCSANPLNYVGYSEACWGLTASDNHRGYAAHSPNNDLGVITPTAAISSLPYTPEESLDAIRHFYYLMGDKLWGEYGFYDAFNITEQWYASSYLAIDQGPVICMIENYRSALLWDLFMSAPEIQVGLGKLGFTF